MNNCSLVWVCFIVYYYIYMITVYYDGKCSLCSREIAHYRRIAPEGSVEWVDITEHSEAFTAKGYQVSDGLKLLHAEDSAGSIHIGVDAFLLIWKRLPYWKWLGTLVGFAPIRAMADWFYVKFAAYRFKRLTHCQIALNNEKR